MRKDRILLTALGALSVASNATFASCGGDKDSPEGPRKSYLEVVSLPNDTTPLDEKCTWTVHGGRTVEFSGPIDEKSNFRVEMKIETYNSGVKLGKTEHVFRKGERFGYRLVEREVTIPIGIIRSVDGDTVEITPVLSPYGGNDCDRPKGLSGAA